MQQQRMVVLCLGFWFCLKQSGQVCPPPTPSQGALKCVVIASSLKKITSAPIHLEKIQHTQLLLSFSCLPQREHFLCFFFFNKIKVLKKITTFLT